MATPESLSQREQEVASLLLQGKSNKQIALDLGISEHTVEFHLHNLYAKLHVSSRSEAILLLGKSTGQFLTRPGESVVEPPRSPADNGDRTTSPEKQFWFTRKFFFLMFLGILVAGGLAYLFLKPAPFTSYERECENPDESTVGQMITRSNASNLKVHGQFGTTSESPWPAKPGYVVYTHIRTPALAELYLKLQYAKNSPTSVPILVFLDDEPSPRARISLTDQHDWNQFTWSKPVLIGKVSSGLHTIEFFTNGQDYGVADLDKFILTAAP